MSEMLRIRNLHKSYLSGQAHLHILAGLELEVAEGEMIAITGASGSGKSTFLHLVGGMEKPDAGEILFHDKVFARKGAKKSYRRELSGHFGWSDITELDRGELARFRNENVGFVFQFHHLLPEFTAIENVMFPLLVRRVKAQEAEAKAIAFLEEVGLSGRAHHKPGELSGGEQQRVAVARALAGEPRLLLADEPTGNLDEHTSQTIFDLLLEIHHSRPLTSIIATHNPRLAKLCHQQRHLSEGKLA